MGTRYQEGDQVYDLAREEKRQGVVQYIRNPDSDSPTYVIDEDGRKFERKASDLRKSDSKQKITMSERKKIDTIRSGDYKNIDEYVNELESAGIKNVDYENIWSGDSGFTAVVTINGQEHAVFEGDMTDHMVKEVKKDLDDIIRVK